MFHNGQEDQHGETPQTDSTQPAGQGIHRYQMRQMMLAIGDDYWIEDDQGHKVYKVDGKALRLRKTLNFEDASGNVLAKIKEQIFHIKDSMSVEGANGEELAVVKKALFSTLRERFLVHIYGKQDLDVLGNILDHEYSIGEGNNAIAQVSKQWFRLAIAMEYR